MGTAAVIRLLTSSLGSSMFARGRPSPGMEFKLGGMDCEIDRPSSQEESVMPRVLSS